MRLTECKDYQHVLKREINRNQNLLVKGPSCREAFHGEGAEMSHGNMEIAMQVRSLHATQPLLSTKPCARYSRRSAIYPGVGPGRRGVNGLGLPVDWLG
jgi:hypothetical protein